MNTSEISKDNDKAYTATRTRPDKQGACIHGR